MNTNVILLSFWQKNQRTKRKESKTKRKKKEEPKKKNLKRQAK